MGFIKIGHDNNGNLLHTFCNGKPESAEFFFTDGDGRCQKANDPIAIEFTQENLKKIVEVFNDRKP